MAKKAKPVAQPLSLAEKIELLFEYRRRPDGRKYTLQDLADRTGLNPATIWKVRRGVDKNPGYNLLTALCSCFKVPLAYFDCQTEETCRQFLEGKVVAEAGEGVSKIAFRAAGLSEEGKTAVARMIEYVRQAEQSEKKTKGKRSESK